LSCRWAPLERAWPCPPELKMGRKTGRARKGMEKNNKDHHRLGTDSVQGKTP